MIIDEGYVKYECSWEKEPFSEKGRSLIELNKVRSKLLSLNMIGIIPDGPGFGNISVRNSASDFIISATNTGHLKELTFNELSLVNKVDVANNKVWCKGVSQASSESMTHATIYNRLKEVNAVIHIHHKKMWKQLINIHSTTSAEIAYGTPEMAIAVGNSSEKLPDNQLLILGGHEDGIISFGATLTSAFNRIEQALKLL